MPEIGGTKLATDFASLMADVRKSIDESKALVTQAAAELKNEITQGAVAAAKAIRLEAATVRQGYSSLLGNAPPATDEKPGPTKQNGGGA